MTESNFPFVKNEILRQNLEKAFSVAGEVKKFTQKQIVE